MTTLEQQARDMLERAGVESAQSMTSGDLVEVANMMNEVYELRAALERERMELVSASVSVSRARELTLAQEIRANNLSAALEAAKSQREAYKLSVYELREQLRHSVSEDALASAQDDLAGCRAALERARALANELQNYAKDKEGEMSVMMAAVVGTMRGIGDRLAALLAAASGGAA